jgi:DNA-binding CsgD family transcriptional regulator
MLTKPFADINDSYQKILNQQHFLPELLDYSIFDKQKPVLENLARLGNSGISVFDLFRKEHIFLSYNFSSLLGYESDEFHLEGQAFHDSRIHPEDILDLSRNGISLLSFCFTLPLEERLNYKLINDFRMLNKNDVYVRVIEQHQVMELDPVGNIWLSLSIIDISPDQNILEGIKCKLVNFKTSEIISLQAIENNESHAVELTPREKQILQMIKGGLLSKEISDKLSISFHTVNTHRQRILEKLNAGNSAEAIALASRLGLIE